MILFWNIKQSAKHNIKIILLYFCGFLSNLQYLKIPNISLFELKEFDDNISQVSTESLSESLSYSSVSVNPRYKRYLTVNVVLNNSEIESNYKRLVSIQQQKQNTNIEYFRKYLFHLYGCEKSETEIERILLKINFIRKSVLRTLKTVDPSLQKMVYNIIFADNPFYKRITGDLTVKLFRLKYYNRPSILKCYFFYPDFAYYTSMMETRFENEIIFQEYAMELSEKLNFITPKIYDYGSCLIKSREFPEYNRVKCMFLIMEDIDGILIKNTDFKPSTCTDIYKLERELQCELLSHNDFMPRNIMRRFNEKTNADEYVILDYGEATLCGTPFKNY